MNSRNQELKYQIMNNRTINKYSVANQMSLNNFQRTVKSVERITTEPEHGNNIRRNMNENMR